MSQRTIADMADALRRHVRLLRAYMQKAYDERDDDYVGEVAGKLRLLAIKNRSNEPLLVRVMAECRLHDVAVVLRNVPPDLPGPQVGDSVTLERFLALPRLTVGLANGQRETLTAQALITLVAEKYGAAHEDWTHPELLTIVRYHPDSIDGYPPLTGALRTAASTVLEIADVVVQRLAPAVIARAEARRETRG